MTKLLIVAPDTEQAKEFAHSHGLVLNGDTATITRSEHIYGYMDVDIVYIGEYWKIPDIERIQQYARIHRIYELGFGA